MPLQSRRRFRNHGFSLVELLVVVAIIAALLAILIPTLSSARESARRAECASRIRQIIAADLNYASDNHEQLIPGTRDEGPNEHCIWISTTAYQAYVKYAGSNLILACPNLDDNVYPPLPFDPGAVDPLGWVMGYDFLGGHAGMLGYCGWVSPMRSIESGSLPLISDLNDWASSDGWTSVAHAYHIPAAAFIYGERKTATQYPSAGGNVGYLDGSVSWKALPYLTPREMCTSDPQYWGMF